MLTILIFLGIMIISCTVVGGEQVTQDKKFHLIENGKVKCTIVTSSGELLSDRLEISGSRGPEYGSLGIETDAAFAINVMYTDWSAPGKVNNADNPVLLTKSDFYIVNHVSRENENGSRELVFDLKGKSTSIELRITYLLLPEAFYVKRKIAVMDTSFGHHFLRWFFPRYGSVNGVESVVKPGGFGQPAALRIIGGEPSSVWNIRPRIIS